MAVAQTNQQLFEGAPGRPRVTLGRLLVVIGVALIFSTGAMQCRAQDDDQGDDLKPQSSSSEPSTTQRAEPAREVDRTSEESQAATPAASAPAPAVPRLIDTSVEEPASSAPASQSQSEPSDQYKAREAKLPEPLKKLVQAPHLYDLSKGGGSEQSEAFVQALALGAACRDDLLFIIENGSPAGKIYAACLLRQFEPSTARQVLDGFKTTKTLVVNKSYTASEHYTMGEVAIDLLSPRPSIILKR